MRPYDVAIVGCGPTGAVLANLCGLHGLRTVVFERSVAPHSEPRACHLDAEIARVLKQCGFGSDLDAVLTVSSGMEFVGPNGARLFSFEGFERAPLLGWYEDYMFYQPELDALVRRGLARFDHVELRVGADAPPVEQLEALADWVVACDGASSGVRSALGIGLQDLGYDQKWLVVDVLLTADVPALPVIIQQVCDPVRPATYVPSHGRHRRWEFRLQPGEEVDAWHLLGAWGIDVTSAELLRAVPYRFHALVARRWRGGSDGRVILAGDAAHQMPPFMGQGMCSGIRDAASLAWRLASPRAPELLAEYEHERRTHVEAVTVLSVQAGTLIDSISADLLAGRSLRLPEPDSPDPTRWSRLPGLDLGAAFPVGHQVPGPPGLDEQLGMGWAWVAARGNFVPPDRGSVTSVPVDTQVPIVVDARATYGYDAVLVRPDRYIAAVTPALTRPVPV